MLGSGGGMQGEMELNGQNDNVVFTPFHLFAELRQRLICRASLMTALDATFISKRKRIRERKIWLSKPLASSALYLDTYLS